MAVAESLTGGNIARELAAAPDAMSWFRGGLVAYSPEVKHQVLGVPAGPVVTEGAGRAMAGGVARLLDADLTVAVTGVGGPGPQEGQPAGTVWFAVDSPVGDRSELCHFDGGPEEIVAATTRAALQLLRDTACAGQLT